MMSELSPEEQALLDAAYERLKNTRRTFTEREALAEARREGYALRLSFDPRFAKAEGRQGSIFPHWRLTEQTLANTHLLNELKAGTWDGRDLDEKLLALDQEDQLRYTFYPHDPRMFQNRLGAWEASGERQITLPLGLKEELDRFKECLHARWTEPFTKDQVLAMLEELGWNHDGITSVELCVRAWLLTCEEFRRVGTELWVPVELLPPEIQRTRLQAPPIRTTLAQADVATAAAAHSNETRKRAQRPESLRFGGTATQGHATWIVTLLSANLIEGFIPVPKAMRGIYPPPSPGEERISVLRGLWFDENAAMWIWLDRTHHRLYGPDLLDAIGLLAAGTKLKVDWNHERIILREAGLDEEVQREETRLLDLDELKRQRGGIGEGYRQALQSLLLSFPEGLTFKEIVAAIRQRQGHEVSHRTIRASLSHGGFLQRDQHWFAAPDAAQGARTLKEALVEALLDHSASDEAQPISHHEYIRTRVAAIRSRLQEITSMLR